jgi:hypothetical protein
VRKLLSVNFVAIGKFKGIIDSGIREVTGGGGMEVLVGSAMMFAYQL